MKSFITLSAWVVDDSNPDPDILNYEPAIMADYNIISYSDVTGQSVFSLKPDPNSYSLKVVCEDSVFDLINADSNYVIQPETVVDLDPQVGVMSVAAVANPTIPDAAAFGQFRAAIAQMRDPNTNLLIWSQQQINDAVGTQVNGRTWLDINIELVDFQKTAPKGTP